MMFMLHSDQESDHLLKIQGQCERGTNCFAYPTHLYIRKTRFDSFFLCIQLKTVNAD